MNKTQKIVVITGAESTGKSTLTKELAEHFDSTPIFEYAREYVEKLNRPYIYSDLEKIARKQIEFIRKEKEGKDEFIFTDTWLIILQVWFEEVFGQAPEWLMEKISNTKIDLFLVCDLDIEWIPDSVRENGDSKRKYLQNRYIELLNRYNFNYEIVGGIGKKRVKNAIQFINSLK